MNEEIIHSVQCIFDLSFFTQNNKIKYGERPIIAFKDNHYFFNEIIEERLSSNPYFKFMIDDIVKSAKEKNKKYESTHHLTLYEKYTRKDVCKLLNWQNDESSTVYGYKTKYNTCPIFITYHKNDDVESSVNYGDEFLSQEVLRWYTRSNRTLNSEEVKTIINAEENHIDVHIFVKKDDDEGTDFYYLGKARPDKNSVKQGKMEDGKPVVKMNMVMEEAIESKLYSYIINGD